MSEKLRKEFTKMLPFWDGYHFEKSEVSEEVYAYIEWLEQRLETGQIDAVVVPFSSKTEAVNWVWENMPMAVKPSRQSKRTWMNPYKSKHARRQIANCIGEKLYDRSRYKLKLGDKQRV